MAEQTIEYQALAAELDMPNPRNLNYVLGAISQAMNQLGDANGISVPPIQFVVVRKDSGIPGDAVGWYARGGAATYSSISLRERRLLTRSILAETFAFPHWLAVLDALELSPSTAKMPSGIDWRETSTGESEAHRVLKEEIAADPSLVGFKGRVISTSMEYVFPSGDAIDVLVTGQKEQLGVEVKPKEAPLSDIVRGLYQCIKYQALAKALLSVEGSPIEVNTVLALGGPLPAELRSLSSTLGVAVVDCLTK